MHLIPLLKVSKYNNWAIIWYIYNNISFQTDQAGPQRVESKCTQEARNAPPLAGWKTNRDSDEETSREDSYADS